MAGEESRRFSCKILLLAVILCSAALFYLGYRYDNKYTYPRHPAGGGITVLDKARYEKRPFLYLLDGWEFYAGRLLIPEEIPAYTPDTFLYIGQYGGFDLGNPDAPRHGSATYRMSVYVDEEPQDYALELPEIFSRWRIWVNGKLVQSVGMDDAKPRPESWMAVFEASGKIEIVVAVSDESGLYSGMVYPPAFGSPEAVGKMLAVRLLIHGGAAAAALIIGILCLLVGLGFRFARPYGELALLCLCFTFYSAYPIIQALGLRNGMWTLLERFCQYAMLSAVLRLQGKLCALPKRLHYSICGIGALVCLGILAQPFASMERAGSYYVFGSFLAGYKWLVAIYLLGAGAWSVWKKKPNSQALMAGLCVFGAGLVVERLFPLYEPVLLGWPVELGGFILMLTATGILWRDTVLIYQDSLVIQEEKRLADVQLAARKEYALLQQEYVSSTRQLLHETRGHFAIIRHHAERGEAAKLIAYVDRLLGSDGTGSPMVYTGHELLDAILTLQFRRARELGIYVEYDFDGIPADLPMPDPDIASIIMNLLDNAAEGCQRLGPCEEKWMELCMVYAEENLVITCGNSAPPPSGGGFATSKADQRGHGYGLSILREIAERYGGELEIEREEDCFVATMHMKLNLSITL